MSENQNNKNNQEELNIENPQEVNSSSSREQPVEPIEPQNESMEVHHHPQLNHKPKPWKEYLLEGLMIFLAVTMGFFAESLRENISAKEKETAYIKSFINNLEEDTATLNYTIGENQTKKESLDSLVALSSKSMAEAANRELLYHFCKSYISFYSRFSSNDATMMQLKNSGGLQYIRHGNIADSIAEYDQEVRNVYASESPYAKAINDAIDAMGQLIVVTVKDDTAYYKKGVYTGKELPLLTTDPQKIQMFFNKIYLESGWTENYIRNLQAGQPFTIRLIALLKKEYGLE